MKSKKTLSVLAALCVLLMASLPGYCNEKPTCAVLVFYPDTDPSETAESRYMAEQYADLLSRTNLFEVMNYKTVDRMLAEKNAQDAGRACANQDCAMDIGQSLEVDYIVYGVIGHIGRLSSLETGLVDIAEGKEIQHAVTDFEGTEIEFADQAPAENIQSLFGISHIPEPATAPAVEETEPQTEAAAVEPVMPEPVEEPLSGATEKKFHIGPRIGLGASNDGIEVGGGFEIQYAKISCQVLMNMDGFAAGISYYLQQTGSSPFLSIVGSYYDTENHGVDEIGRIYGLLAGYRWHITDPLNLRVALGTGHVNWDQTELNRKGTKDKDEEIIPVFELSLGYMF